MIRLRSLGESVIQVRDIRVGPESEVLFGALLYLLVARGRQIPRSVLIELFWPGPDENASRHCARQLLYRLRQIGVPLEGDNGSVAISLPNAELDYEALLAADEPDAVMGRSAIVFLPGYAPRLSPRFDEWLEEHREHVHGRLRKTLLRRVKEARSEARWSDVEMLARQCLSCDPLNEEATLALAEATALGGGKAQALAIIDRYLRELGPDSRDIRIPATVLRRRIVDQLPGPALSGTTETQFVGRDASVAMLNELLRSARSSVGRACVIEGVAGIGKSRLAAEVSAAAALQGVNVRRVICQESDRERPLSAFADLVPTLLSLRGAAGCSPESLGFLRRLTEHDSKATQPSETAREAEFLAAQIRQSLFDLMDAVASERTLMLVVENAHRLDPTSWKVFREMFEWVRTRQVLVVLTMREVPAGVLGESALDGTVLRHRLGPLSDADASTVFTTFIEKHGTAVLEAHRAWCVRIAEGSPFYLRELASHWLTTRETESLPPSLSALIDARLSCLTVHTLRVLQICALLGKNATHSRIERVLEYPRHELIDAFDELERGGFLLAEGEYLASRHDLLSDRAVGGLSTIARRIMHQGAGEVLESDAEASHSAGLLWDCAQHWFLAGRADRALGAARRCARYLVEVGLPLEAADTLEKAGAFTSNRDDMLAVVRERIEALRLAGKWTGVLNLTEELRRLGQTGSKRAPTGDDVLVLLESRWRNAHPVAELYSLARTCMADSAQPIAIRSRAGVQAIILADNMCDPNEANDSYREMATFRALGADESVLAEADMIFHCNFGDLDRSLKAGARVVDLHRCESTPLRLSRTLRHAAQVLMRGGLLEDSYSMFLEALDLSRKYRLTSSTASALGYLSTIRLIEGDLPQARQWYEESLECSRSLEDSVTGTWVLNLGLRLALAEGDHEKAQQVVERVMSDAAQSGALRSYVSALSILVCLRYQQNKLRTIDATVDHLRSLHASVMAMGSQDFVAVTLYKVLRDRGQEAEAEANLELYRTIRRERYQLPLHLVSDAH